tara:strand:- start:156 stop:608 length:453 start_codon:yes stop_codon:yes gene_type:complete
MESVTLDEIEFYYNITENQFNDNAKKNYTEDAAEEKEIVKTKSLVNKKNKATVKEKSLPPKKKAKKVKIVKPNKYVVQVGAWPSIEQAKIDQKELYEQGFDAYIEKYFFEKRQSFWYRVRIGDFENKSKAEEVKKRVDKIRPSKSWLTKK